MCQNNCYNSRRCRCRCSNVFLDVMCVLFGPPCPRRRECECHCYCREYRRCSPCGNQYRNDGFYDGEEYYNRQYRLCEYDDRSDTVC